MARKNFGNMRFNIYLKKAETKMVFMINYCIYSIDIKTSNYGTIEEQLLNILIINHKKTK